MRLTVKLTLALTFAILAVFGTNSFIRVRRDMAAHEEDSRNDSRLLGRAVADATARMWQRFGEAEALDLVADANERESHVLIRWVWLDAPAGDPHAPDVPRALLTAAARGGTSVLKARVGAGPEALYTYVPSRIPGPRRGAIELRESLDAERDYLRRTILQATLATAILVLSCAAITLGLGAALVGRPVRRLVAQARRIGVGDLSSRLEIRQRDEIGELADEMNRMSQQLVDARARVASETAAKLAAVEQLRHADRLATVGKLASGIGHEVGTPLNVITGHSQILMDEYPPGTPAHDNSAIVAQQARRVAEIVRQLLDFARPRPIEPVDQQLGPMIRQVARLLDSLAQKKAITIVAEPVSDDTHACVDSGQIQQVLTNLVVNAIHASPRGAQITLGAGRVVAEPPADVSARAGEYQRIFVKDEGTGIEPHVLPHVFEPFFTTKDVGQGTGLGLSVAYGIVKEHGGWIDVKTEMARGTCFTVYLPVGSDS